MSHNDKIIDKIRKLTNNTEEKGSFSTESLFPSTAKGKVISINEFSKLEPSDIEIFVVKPVKKIVSFLSHVVTNTFS